MLYFPEPYKNELEDWFCYILKFNSNIINLFDYQNYIDNVNPRKDSDLKNLTNNLFHLCIFAALECSILTVLTTVNKHVTNVIRQMKGMTLALVCHVCVILGVV